jgi:integrase
MPHPPRRDLAVVADVPRIPLVDEDRIAVDAAALPAAVSSELAADLERAGELSRGRRAAATVRGYEADLRVLFAYLADVGQPAQLPVHPLLVAAFIAAESRPVTRKGHERAARAPATLSRRVAAIAKAHQLAELPDPSKDQRVRDALLGARRALAGKAPSEAKDALELEHLAHMLAAIPKDKHAGRRDRALLLVGIAAALRRSELVALDVADLQFVPEGMIVSVRRSKTDQTGRGFTLAIAKGEREAMCAVGALQTWLDGAGIDDGPIFRRVRAGDHLTDARLTDQSVAAIVKKRALAIGLDDDHVARLAAHSLRSGGITAAALEGHPEREIARLSRHTDMAVLRAYIQQSDEFDHAAQVLASRVL